MQLQLTARLPLVPSNKGQRLRHFDRLAEMGDRLLEGGAAQRLVARLSPPFDREIVEAGLSEMMRERFRLGRRALGLVAQEFGGATVQRLAAALEQALVSRVLDQRVLEAVVRLRSVALDEQDVGLGKPLHRRPQASLVEAGHGLEQRMRKVTPEHCTDLRDFPCGAEPVQSARRAIAARSAGSPARRPRRRAPRGDA